MFPFKIAEEKLHQTNASEPTELVGNGLRDDEVVIEANQEDAADNTNNPVENATSPRCNYLTIREDNKHQLEPGHLLNDTLVDFWMSWVSSKFCFFVRHTFILQFNTESLLKYRLLLSGFLKTN